MAAEGAIDNVTERFIINLREDSESDSESDNASHIGIYSDFGSAASDDEGDMSGIEEIELSLEQYWCNKVGPLS